MSTSYGETGDTYLDDPDADREDAYRKGARCDDCDQQTGQRCRQCLGDYGAGPADDRDALTYHPDGSITYWSVYHQCWTRRAFYVPTHELAALSPATRDRFLSHLATQEAP